MIPWIQIYSNLLQHKKVYKLAEILGIKSAYVRPNVDAAGLLVSLWTWAAQNAPDGDLSDCSPQMIADAAGWTKKPDDFHRALLEAGLLDTDGRIHDWDEYAFLYISSVENAKQKTRERVEKYREKKRECNTDVM